MPSTYERYSSHDFPKCWLCIPAQRLLNSPLRVRGAPCVSTCGRRPLRPGVRGAQGPALKAPDPIRTVASGFARVPRAVCQARHAHPLTAIEHRVEMRVAANPRDRGGPKQGRLVGHEHRGVRRAARPIEAQKRRVMRHHDHFTPLVLFLF